jgi:deoxyribose-phosphate aldolase
LPNPSLESRVHAVLSASSRTVDLPADLDVAALIDHTLLKPEATSEHVRGLCGEGREHGFASVCVAPVFVTLAAELLAGSGVRVGTVAGFPLGSATTEQKAFEVEEAMSGGAQEVDMVLNLGALKGGDHDFVVKDIRAVAEVCHASGGVLKVIIETALLSDVETVLASLLVKDAGADFVKTSTGFAPGGANAHDVSLMRRAVGDDLGVKAAGGIRTLETALQMIRAGASRLGTSTGVQIALEARRIPRP